MEFNPGISLKIILRSALALFAVPVLFVILILLLFGVAEFVVTHSLTASLDNLSTITHSTGFRLMAHIIHMMVAAVVGFRLANRTNLVAIPYIWAAVFLAVALHFFIHTLMGVSFAQLFTDIAFVELPVMMVMGSFIGLHASFWQRFGGLLEFKT